MNFTLLIIYKGTFRNSFRSQMKMRWVTLCYRPEMTKSWKPPDILWPEEIRSVTHLSLAWRGNCQRKWRWLKPLTAASGTKAWWRSAPWTEDAALAVRLLAASRARGEKKGEREDFSAIWEGLFPFILVLSAEKSEAGHIFLLFLTTFATCSRLCRVVMKNEEVKNDGGF